MAAKLQNKSEQTPFVSFLFLFEFVLHLASMFSKK